MDISVVIPVRNEEDNIGPLISGIMSVANSLKQSVEVIIVNDHSTDRTLEISRAAENNNNVYDCKFKVRSIDLVSEKGKDHALMVGMLEAEGAIIVTMDGDLQNDPRDIPLLVNLLGDNDMVCGIRSKRDDSLLKRVTSKIANRYRNFITGDQVIDAGCAMRVMKKGCVTKLEEFNSHLFGAAHYFYPTLLKIQGCKVVQAPISHQSRLKGKSKFNIMRGRVISGICACYAVRKIKRKLGIRNEELGMKNEECTQN